MQTVKIPQTVKVPLRPSMREAASLRAMTIESYLVQLHDADFAETARLKIPPDFLTRDMSAPAPRIASKRGRCCSLPPVQIQRLLYVHDSENLSPSVLAKRFHCAESTVRRILEQRAQSGTHTLASYGRKRRRKHGPNISLPGSRS